MGSSAINLPPGFVVDNKSMPNGFQLDKAEEPAKDLLFNDPSTLTPLERQEQMAQQSGTTQYTQPQINQGNSAMMKGLAGYAALAGAPGLLSESAAVPGGTDAAAIYRYMGKEVPEGLVNEAPINGLLQKGKEAVVSAAKDAFPTFKRGLGYAAAYGVAQKLKGLLGDH